MEETESVKPNGKKLWTNWPGIYQVAKQLGLSVPQVRLLVEAGDLPKFDAPDATMRFDPSIIKEMRPIFSALTPEDFGEKDPEKESKVLDSDSARRGIDVEAIRLQSVFVQKVLDHNQKLHDLLLQSHEQNIKTLSSAAKVQTDTIGRLETELKHHREQFDSLMRARETAADEAAAREIAIKEVDATNERRREVLELAKTQAGKIVNIVGAKLGISEATLKGWNLERVTAVAKFFESFGADQLDVAMASGFFTPEQVELLSSITGRKKVDVPAESEPEEKVKEAS